MSYCPNCGSSVEHDEAERASRAEIQIAKINAERDITLARLQARAMREELDTTETVTEMQTDAQVESAVATAEVVAATMEPPEEETPVIVDGGAPEPEPEPEPELPPKDAGNEPRPAQTRRGFF